MNAVTIKVQLAKSKKVLFNTSSAKSYFKCPKVFTFLAPLQSQNFYHVSNILFIFLTSKLIKTSF